MLAKQLVSCERQLAFHFRILEHLNPDEDERPPTPSASSHETPIDMENTMSEVEVDREVDVPPPALPPAAPLVVDASPN